MTSLLLAFSALLLGVLLSALQTPLYRVLEGYYLPERLRDHWIDTQRQRKLALQEKLQAKRKANAAVREAAVEAAAATGQDGGTRPPKEVNTDLLLERLHRYPVDDQLVPLLRPYWRAPSTDQKDEQHEKDGAGGAPVSDPAPRPLDR